MSEKITIKKIARKDMPSKFKEGDTYKMTQVIDIEGRKMTAFGKWAENWKEGDTPDVIINKKSWKDRDGFEQISLNLENPNKSTGSFGGGSRKTTSFNPMLTIYNSAAMFAVALAVSGTKKKLKLEDLDRIAEHIKEKTSETSEAIETKEVPSVDVDKETNKKKTKVKDEEELDIEEESDEDDDFDDDEDGF